MLNINPHEVIGRLFVRLSTSEQYRSVNLIYLEINEERVVRVIGYPENWEAATAHYVDINIDEDFYCEFYSWKDILVWFNKNYKKIEY